MSDEFHLVTGNLPSDPAKRQKRPKGPPQTGVVTYRRKDQGKTASQRCKTAGDLPDWVKRALTYRVITGALWRDVALAFDRSPELLKRYAHTQGANEWSAFIREEANKLRDDPQAWVKLAAAREAPFWFVRGYVHYLGAEKAGDRAEAGKMIRHMQEVTGVKQPVQQTSSPTVFNVTIQGQSFTVEAPTGSSSYTPVIQAEVIENG
jgi:hypothetical protein